MSDTWQCAGPGCAVTGKESFSKAQRRRHKGKGELLCLACASKTSGGIIAQQLATVSGYHVELQTESERARSRSLSPEPSTDQHLRRSPLSASPSSPAAQHEVRTVNTAFESCR